MSGVRDLLRAGARPLREHSTGTHPGVAGKDEAQAELTDLAPRLGTLQEMLYAEGARAVLLVLQGMDTCGKDGTVKHLARAVNPVGLHITSFKKPTAEELAHDFLWRVHRATPAAGQLGIFNRSHYEDVGIVRAHGLVPAAEIERRYGAIEDFERELAGSGTVLVKCFLHLSHDEQRERLLARLDDPTKRWKFREGDLDERARWDDYQEAYELAIARCSGVPWYVVPADRRWYRNWAVAHLLAETLEDMGVRYPDPPLDVPALKARLA